MIAVERFMGRTMAAGQPFIYTGNTAGYSIPHRMGPPSPATIPGVPAPQAQGQFTDHPAGSSRRRPQDAGMQYAGLGAGWDTEFIPEPLHQLVIDQQCL